MNSLLNVTLTGQAEAVERLRRYGPAVMAAVLSKTQALTIKLQRHVVEDKLSGQVLNVRTGALRRSITQDVTMSGSVITGRVYSSGDVKYAGIHEYGGLIQMPPRAFSIRLRTDAKGGLLRQASLRKNFIGPKTPRQMAYEANGAIFARKTHKQATERAVSHNGYTITMPERSFLRSSLSDMAFEIETGLKYAVFSAAVQS